MPLENWPPALRSALFRLLGIHWAQGLLKNLSTDQPSKRVLLERIFERNNFDVKVSGAEKIP
jgi:hypothetical protein